MAQSHTLMTAEQLMELAGDRRVELVRGELVEMSPVGLLHGHLVVRLGSWLEAFVAKLRLGIVGTEVGVILSRDPDIVRAPDIAFISSSRLAGQKAEGFFVGAPDLAVEVLSPNDKASDIQEKIREYLAAGTRLLWVVDPHTQTVTAYHASGDAHVYSGAEPVTGEDVLPGFSFLPADLFRD